jgi:hypothetical protein
MLFLFVRPFYLYPHSHIPCIMHILFVICCICAHWFVKCFGVVAPISCAGLLVHCFSLFFLLCPEFLWSDYAYCCSCFDLLTFVHSTGCLWQFLCYNLRWNAACLLHYLLANIPVTFFCHGTSCLLHDSSSIVFWCLSLLLYKKRKCYVLFSRLESTYVVAAFICCALFF